MRFFKIFPGGFGEDGGREGTKDFAVLDAAIQNFFHFRTTRIGDNAAIAERPRSPLGTVLEPTEDFSISNNLRGFAHEVRLSEFSDRITVTRKGAGIDSVSYLIT